MTVTVHDVAQLAGVAPQTVSNVFRHPARVADNTSRRVRLAAAQLGFIPASAARRLRGIPLPFVGVAAVGRTTEQVETCVAQIDAACWSRGMTTQVIDVREDIDALAALKLLRDLGAGAVVLVCDDGVADLREQRALLAADVVHRVSRSGNCRAAGLEHTARSAGFAAAAIAWRSLPVEHTEADTELLPRRMAPVEGATERADLSPHDRSG